MAARLVSLSRFAQKVACNRVLHAAISRNGARNLSLTSILLDAIKLKMPSLSPTMSEGTIVQWLKQEGDEVKAGDIVCEIQTDKAVVGFEVDEDGILAKILKPDNSQNVPINTVIALMVAEGEEWQNVAIPADVESGGGGVAPPATTTTTEHKPTDHSLHSYGPAVRSILELYNMSPSDIKGSGPHNRILKGDLLKYIKQNNLKPAEHSAPLPKSVVPPKSTPAVSTASATSVHSVKTQPLSEKPISEKPRAKTSSPPQDGAQFTDIELTNMRRIIAKRLTESKMSTPHAYCTIDCDIGSLTALRKEFVSEGEKVSVNDFIVKAVAVALQRVPEVNSIWTGDGGRAMSNIDVSVAVATATGLITPIVKDAVGLGIGEIARVIRELAGRAKEGRLKPEEYQGGTFTISNLGMFGVSEFTAVINPPQACIMAVGGARVELGVDGTPHTMMQVTLSTDSRIVDEFLATKFLEAFQELIENPMMLLSQTPKVNLDKLFAK